HGVDEGDDFDAVREGEVFFCYCSCGDTADGLTGAAATAAAGGFDAVFHLAEAEFGAGLDLDTVFFVAGSGEGGLAGAAAGHLRLDVGFGEGKAGGAAIDDAADGETMGFAIAVEEGLSAGPETYDGSEDERGDPEILPKEFVSQPFQYHVYLSRTHQAALNLSIEQYLFQKTHPDSTVLFLYVNEPCVVIGRNQNPWLEVNHALARRGVAIGGPYSSKDEVPVIRRRSGGGTVFHDRGNVNFSVIYPQKIFHRDKYAEMMVRAIRKTNPRARVNERHDIVLDQGLLVEEQYRPDPSETHRTSFGSSEFRKVSGSAYKLARGRALHHGTCLLSSPNLPSISEYLRSPAAAFMKARGVESVRSPIANITDQPEVKSEPDTSAFQHQIVEAFVQMHGLNMHELSPSVRNSSGCRTLEGNGQIASGILDVPLLEIDEIRREVEEIQARVYLKAKQGVIIETRISLSEDPRWAEEALFAGVLKKERIMEVENFWDLFENLFEHDRSIGVKPEQDIRHVCAWLDLMLGKMTKYPVPYSL
ncbi:MAG: hypothetical protein Q9212_007246, partial [Teloschistes hypoglaucus]